MFCKICGKQLPDGAKFCDNCGSAQGETAPRAEKKRKKALPILCAVAAVAVIAVLAAVLLPMLLPPGTETVYLLTEKKIVSADGSTSVQGYRYDAFGNLTDGWNAHLPRTFEATFDKQGNLRNTNSAWDDYKYTYDEEAEDRPLSCRQTSGDREVGEWSFTWDKQGNLTQALFDGENTPPYGMYPRADFAYDGQGRLIREYFFSGVPVIKGEKQAYEYYVLAFEYTYDREDNPVRVEYGVSEAFRDYEDAELQELDIDWDTLYEFEYFAPGKLAGMTRYDPQTGRDASREFSYDGRGNYIPEDRDYTLEYDGHGNVIRQEYDSGAVHEYTYEAVELPVRRARSARTQMRLLYMDPVHLALYPAPDGDHAVATRYFFYNYWIPNPIW